jgi:hypothetical protein
MPRVEKKDKTKAKGQGKKEEEASYNATVPDSPATRTTSKTPLKAKPCCTH